MSSQPSFRPGDRVVVVKEMTWSPENMISNPHWGDVTIGSTGTVESYWGPDNPIGVMVDWDCGEELGIDSTCLALQVIPSTLDELEAWLES